MTFATFERDDRLVLQIAGALDAVTRAHLHPEVERIVRDPRDLDIDLSRVDAMDSFGVGVIVSLWTKLRASGFQVRIVGLRDNPLAVFRILNLDRVMVTPAPVPRGADDARALNGTSDEP